MHKNLPRLSKHLIAFFLINKFYSVYFFPSPPLSSGQLAQCSLLSKMRKKAKKTDATSKHDR
jgi:hypothetical protein